ncbi:flagellar hook-length control protein FliK [Ammoniphilus sp. CFH 90114]|uniref:flagellar hook-length control protein FliK n=1 Tax=Ammoniphilus sp. CFH 90114 TaxID=2493665 RepID=UPI00100FDDB8|nr:flagellar hook-length control protein FliK [Ammoniphilus sp. CFH 90114]RXT15118.1 flagellar hook-length control protein FliK [Ammoniphilus sp. CFH 90114]
MKLMSMAEQLFLQPTPNQGLSLTPGAKTEENGLFAGLLELEEAKFDKPIQEEVMKRMDEILASLSGLIELMNPRQDHQIMKDSSMTEIRGWEQALQNMKYAIERDGDLSEATLNKVNEVLKRLLQEVHTVKKASYSMGELEFGTRTHEIPKLIQQLSVEWMKMTGGLLRKGEDKAPLQDKALIPLVTLSKEFATEISRKKIVDMGKKLTDSEDMTFSSQLNKQLNEPVQTAVSLPSIPSVKEFGGDNIDKGRQVPIEWLAKQLEPVFSRTFSLKNGQQVHEMILQLKPESLGKLDVKIQEQNGQLTARFVVESLTAKQAVEEQLVQLRQNLLSQGISVHNIEVVESSSTSYMPFQQQKQQQDQRQFFFKGKKAKEYIDLEEDIGPLRVLPQTKGESGINYTV